jgi:HlyD family secretion protein
MKKRWWWIAGGVVVLGAAGGFFVAKRGPRPTPVQMAAVERQDLQARVSANGKIQAQKKVDISATIPGQVTHLAVKEGDQVTKGQFLLEIDPVNARAAARSSEASMEALRNDLESARANLEQFRIDFARAEANHEARIISESDYQRARTAVATARSAVDAAERRVAQARAMLEGARDTLAKTVVRAPMDGVVTAKRVEEGEVAVIGVQNSPGTVLLTISDMSVVEAEMEVDETSIPAVKAGQDARIRIDAYPNRTFDGVVTEVGSSPLLQAGAVEQAIKFKVKIQLRNPPEGVKPGLSVQADILTGFRPEVVAVPLQALIVRDVERKPGEKLAPGAPREEEGVYVVENGKVRFQTIATGLIGELSIEVVEGLKGGESIVTGPFRALRALKPGDGITKEKATPAAPGAAGQPAGDEAR